MPVPIALTSPERTYLAGPSTLKRFLSYVPTTSNSVATARVNQASFTYPVAQLTVDGTSAGWSGVAAGMSVYVGSAAGLHDRGIFRVRKAGDSTTLYIMETAEGDSGLLADGYRLASFQDNDYITVYNRFDLWSVIPRILYSGSGTAATFYEDYDAAVGTANTTPGPRSNNITINGTYGHFACQVANGGTQAFTCIAAPDLWPTSSSITTHAWTAPAAATGVSGSTTDTLTMTLPVGFHVLKYVSTENNSATLISYRCIWVHDDPQSGTFPALPIASISSDSRDRSGRRMTITLNNTGLSNIPDGAMVLYWEQATWSGQDITSASTRFVGWINRNTWQITPGLKSSECEIVGPAALLALLGGYSQQFDTATSPAAWQQIVSSLAYIDFMPWWLLRTRAANVLQLFDYTPMGISNLTGRLTTWRFDGGNLFQQCQNLAASYTANFGCDSLGNFFCRQHPSLIDTSLRVSQVVTRDTLDASLYTEGSPVNQLKPQDKYVKGEAFYSDGITNTPVLTESPGKAPGQGPNEQRLQSQLCESQSDLDSRTGHYYAMINNPWGSVPLHIFSNRDVYEPAHMSFVSVTVPVSLAPDGAGWTKNVIPLTISKQHNDDGTADINFDGEAETAGVPASPVPVPPADTNVYGQYSNPLNTPLTPIPSTWGAQNSAVPFAWLHACADGFVVAISSTGSVFRNISPTTSQRSAIGAVIKMIADPWNYKRLILYGQSGFLICDDATISSPTWRAFTLASGGSVGLLTSLTISALGTHSYTTFNSVLGQSYTFRLSGTCIINSGGPTQADAEYFDANNNFATVTWGGSNPGVTPGIMVDGVLIDHLPYASDHIYEVVITGTGSPFDIHYEDFPYGDNSGSLQCDIYTSVSASNEVQISDVVGSINRRGWFAWLTKKTVAGNDYVYVNTTTNYFASTVSSVQVAAYSASMQYAISMSSYNAGANGVGYVTAGDPGGSDAKYYKTTNWFSSVSAGSSLNSRGGQINVPYAKSGGAANSGTTPQVVYIKGLNGADLENIATDGTTNTTITGGSKYGQGPYSLQTFTLDGSYIYFVATDGTLRVSADGGKTWSAGTAIPKSGSTVYGVTGSPTNRAFLLGFGDQCLAYSTNSGSSFTNKWSTYDTFRSGAFGSGGTIIVTAFADLGSIYSRPITS